MCTLASVNRAGYYRRWQASAPRQAETALRDRLQQLALAHRHYGYRRLAALLRRDGWRINHKRVLRLTRQDNLLCLRKKAFVPATTHSTHSWRVYPNKARGMELTGCNQLWVADITYVRLQEEFVYLAVVLDAYSRMVLGWALARHLQSSLAVEALRHALASREITPGLIHHSDRGVQYACRDYVELLEGHELTISMSRIGNPYDNAKAESFMKTLKAEEVEGNQYRTLEELRASLQHFLETVYNQKRLHSALGYRSPVEFEQQTQEPNQLTTAGGSEWLVG
jgi:putative transposase